MFGSKIKADELLFPQTELIKTLASLIEKLAQLEIEKEKTKQLELKKEEGK